VEIWAGRAFGAVELRTIAQGPKRADLSGRLADISDLVSLDMTNGSERAPLRYRQDDRITNRYVIRGILGGGGYSAVYEAYDEYLDETIALKVFAPNYGFDPVRREIQALRRLSHPSVVQVIDVGRIETEPPQWFMKLEFVVGRTLRETLDEAGPLAASDVRSIGLQLLSALCEIHPNGRRIADLSQKPELSAEEFNELQDLQSSGVLHRDIKPENILHDGDTITIIDFNLATPVGARVDTRSHTPDYSPSLLALERWDVHPDLHAAAVTLFELLEGRKPDRKLLDSPGSDPGGMHGPAGFLDFVRRSLSVGGFATARDMLEAFEDLPWEQSPASERPPLESEVPSEGALLARFQPGQVVRGRVRSMTDFGVFVDLGDVEGMVHVSQISWAYVQRPQDVLQIDDEVEAVVVEVDESRNRIGLSVKELQPDPWIAFTSSQRVGDLLEGDVTGLVPYGAFVSLGDGIQALVHVSELADHFVEDPADVVAVGDHVVAKLIDMDLQRRRLALSIRQV
jgi:predicted RNA-binding protein with RPS1 domain/tRNA A-37 threonylcarbamoyl transferase component Bud32